MKYRIPHLSIAAAGLAVTCFNAHAETRDTLRLSNLPIEQLMEFEVETASKRRQKIADAPAAMSIVTSEDIRIYGYRTLADILDSIRGLYTSYDRNYEYLGSRGFAVAGDYNTRVLLLVDGIRYNDALYDQASIGTDFAIDVDLIERVEFISGPSSAVYGSNALYGVINVITKGGAALKGVNASVSSERYNTGKVRVSAGAATARGGSWLVSASRAESRGDDLYYPEFDTPEQNHGVAEDADFDRSTTLLGKYTDDEFTVTASHGKRTKGIPTASYEQRFNDNRAETIDERTTLGLEARHAVATATTLTGRIYGSHYDYHGDYVYDVEPALNTDKSEADWYGIELQLETRLGKHGLVSGIEYRYDARLDQLNFDAPPYTELVNLRTTANTRSLYAQDEYQATDKLLLNVGVRLDTNSVADSNVNPRVGAIYSTDSGAIIKALYGTAFRSPNAYELYYYAALNDAALGSSAVEHLAEERLRSTELILEYPVAASQRVSVSVFRNEIDDLIALVAGERGELHFANTTSARTTGAEFEWQGAWANGVRAKTSYSWQRTEDSAGGDLVNSPRNLLKLNVAGPLPFGLGYGVELRGVSSRKTLQARTGGYLVTNVTLRAQPTSHTEIALSAYNLFDQKFNDPVSPEHVQDSIEQDGRNFRLKVDYWF